jgi:hypothetical protein
MRLSGDEAAGGFRFFTDGRDVEVVCRKCHNFVEEAKHRHPIADDEKPKFAHYDLFRRNKVGRRMALVQEL